MQWTTSWSMNPVETPYAPRCGQTALPLHTFAGSIRYLARLSLGGNLLRVRLFNAHDATPLCIENASIGLCAGGLAAHTKSLRPLTFAGYTSALIPRGTSVASDPIELSAGDGADVLITAFFPSGATLMTYPIEPAFGAAIMSHDATAHADPTAATPIATRPIASAIEVQNPRARGTLIAFGDSITDSVIDAHGVRGWADLLAPALTRKGLALANAGINANRMLRPGPASAPQPSGLARLERDVLSLQNATHLVVLLGINDIGMSGRFEDAWWREVVGESEVLTAAELIGGYEEIIAKARAHGLNVFGGTLTPFHESIFFTPEKEAVRQAANEWIRSSGAFDAVIDFDARLRDPGQPERLTPSYDSGDHLHLSAEGNRAMASAFDLSLFA